jgi:predicted GNAT family N-acyltransferase
MKWRLRIPETDEDFAQYYDLRWRVLRAPWQQPRGSERDELDPDSYHVMICDAEDRVCAVGRIHRDDDHCAQIRYMAVEQGLRHQGLGEQVLAALETKAREWRCERVMLHARRGYKGFYINHGYRPLRPSHTLFNRVQHVLMEKELTK